MNLNIEINYDYPCAFPYVSPDGKYLFFTSHDELNNESNIYWVNSSIIEKIRPKKQ